MEITKYELFEIPPRWLFLKIETDTGLVGWWELSINPLFDIYTYFYFFIIHIYFIFVKD